MHSCQLPLACQHGRHAHHQAHGSLSEMGGGRQGEGECEEGRLHLTCLQIAAASQASRGHDAPPHLNKRCMGPLWPAIGLAIAGRCASPVIIRLPINVKCKRKRGGEQIMRGKGRGADHEGRGADHEGRGDHGEGRGGGSQMYDET